VYLSETHHGGFNNPIIDRMTLFARADFPYTGRPRGYFDSSGLTHLFQPAQGVLNMSTGVTLNGLSLSLYAKNLLNWKNIIQYPSVNSVQEGTRCGR
jgi:hypothetical protein